MRWLFFRPAAALAFAAVLIPGAPAQTAPVQAAPPQAQTTPPPDATTLVPPVRPFRLPARIGVFGEARITLQQALAMALANNKDIEASRIDREISGYSLTGARGLYDPTIGAVSQFLKQVNPVASSLGGSATGAVLNRTWQTDPTLSGFTPWLGGSYRTDFSSQHAYTNNTFFTLNPQYLSLIHLSEPTRPY
jgi:outer membrane protein TolC